MMALVGIWPVLLRRVRDLWLEILIGSDLRDAALHSLRLKDTETSICCFSYQIAQYQLMNIFLGHELRNAMSIVRFRSSALAL
jgi:hypothetical protein